MSNRKLVVTRSATCLAAVVLSLGSAASAGAAGTLAGAHRDATTAALQLRAAGVRHALDTTLQRYADTMHDLVAAAATVPRAELPATVTRLVADGLPGAHQVLVVDPERAVAVQHTVDGSSPPAQPRLDADPALADAMRLARTTGRVVASAAHVLPADGELPAGQRPAAVDLAAPVHAAGQRFVGWVLVRARAHDLLEAALRPAGLAGVATVLSEAAPDGARREVARWADGADRPLPGQPASTVDLPFAGHAWQVTVRPTTALLDGSRAAAGIRTLTAGVLLTLLLTGLVLVLATARDRARRRASDADRRRRAAAARAAHAEATRRAGEAELVGFTAAAGEHLHAPLHTIAGFTELLIEETGPDLDEAARGFLDRIGASTRRMLAVVDDLLAYTTATDAALRLAQVDADQLATDVVAQRLGDLPGPRPSVDVGPLPVVTADAGLLRQVLDQLVDNAVRFVRHGGTARVTVSARPAEAGWWRIEVADRGIGVPVEHRSRIFTPFHRTPAAEGFPGTGLGLAICRRIVELHGGELGVEGNPGGGSVFWFTVGEATAGHPLGEPHELAAGRP